MRKSSPLIPLWALVLGPLWIPIFVAWYLIYSLFAIIWLIPISLACEIFGWRMPNGVMPKWFSDEYEMMP